MGQFLVVTAVDLSPGPSVAFPPAPTPARLFDRLPLCLQFQLYLRILAGWKGDISLTLFDQQNGIVPITYQ